MPVSTRCRQRGIFFLKIWIKVVRKDILDPEITNVIWKDHVASRMRYDDGGWWHGWHIFFKNFLCTSMCWICIYFLYTWTQKIHVFDIAWPPLWDNKLKWRTTQLTTTSWQPHPDHEPHLLNRDVCHYVIPLSFYRLLCCLRNFHFFGDPVCFLDLLPDRRSYGQEWRRMLKFESNGSWVEREFQQWRRWVCWGRSEERD